MSEGIQVKVERKRLFENYFNIQCEVNGVTKGLLQKDWEIEMEDHQVRFKDFYKCS